MAKPPKDPDHYSEEETARRRDAVVKHFLTTPPKPHSKKRAEKAKPAAKPKSKPSHAHGQ